MQGRQGRRGAARRKMGSSGTARSCEVGEMVGYKGETGNHSHGLRFGDAFCSVVSSVPSGGFAVGPVAAGWVVVPGGIPRSGGQMRVW